MTTANENNNMQPTNESVKNSIDTSAQLPTENRKKGFIIGHDSEFEEIEYTAIDGKAIFDGDILLGTAKEMEQFAEQVRTGAVPRGAGITNEALLWPKGRIPYVIDSSIDEEKKKKILAAMTEWSKDTPIQFDDLTDLGEENIQENYVRIEKKESGCFSMLGMIDKANKNENYQVINLGEDSCYKHGTILHELGHTIGLFHEHARSNRDKFVEIIKDDIEDQEDKFHNFERYEDRTIQGEGLEDRKRNETRDGYEGWEGKDFGVYDFNSIMHYHLKAFGKGEGKDKKATIRIKANALRNEELQQSILKAMRDDNEIDAEENPSIQDMKDYIRSNVGQREKLSPGDIAAVNEMYGGEVKSDPEPQPDPKPEPEPEPKPEPPQPTQEIDIVSIYQYYADKPVWRYLYDKKQSEGFIRDGWKLDRVAFRAFGSSQSGTIPVYRFVAKEPWRYMLSREEAIDGWINEGEVFYAFENEEPDIQDANLSGRIRPIYEYYAVDAEGRWRYQYSPQSDVGEGWQSQGSAFYALSPTDS